MKHYSLIILLLSLSMILPAALLWNEPVAIRQGVNIEWFRTGCETHDGGAIYVWSDTQDGGRDLWAQKVDALGNLVWNEPVLIDGKPDRQEDPVITRTSDDCYIIAWIDFYNNIDGDVYAQKIDANGNLLWAEGGMPVCVHPATQIGLNMEADENGGAFIVWGEGRNTSEDLYAQRISASGAPLWTLNGIPVADGDGNEIQNTMLPDGAGGMILAYTSTYVGDADIYAKRFDGNGNMVWAEALELAVATANQEAVRMAALANGDFVFTWMDSRNNDPDIYAQKVNLAGQKLWGEYLVVQGEEGVGDPLPQRNPRIQATSDNAVVITWEDFRTDVQSGDLYAQKLSAAGTKLWGDGGIAITDAEFQQTGQRMAKDSSGGVYVVWDDYRNENQEDIYAQHLSATGEALWTPGGKAICVQPFEQNGGLVKVSGDNVFINWMDARNGSIGIYYQVLNAAGEIQLAENGEEVFWGLSGDSPKEQYLLLNRPDDLLIVWQDTRFGNDGYRIFYQFMDEDGNVILETNGRPVTVDGGSGQEDPAAAVAPDGSFAVVWKDNRSGDANIYAQLFSPAGERLWGDNGIKITATTSMGQDTPYISYYNGAYYIGWSNWDDVEGTDTRYFHVYGQLIQNGEKQWGEDGILISVFEDGDMENECILSGVYENFYVWHSVKAITDDDTIWAQRLNLDGSPAAGWGDYGKALGLYQLEEYDSYKQLYPEAAITPQGLFVLWREMRGSYIFSLHGQHISRDGEFLWEEEGLPLAATEREQSLPAIAITNHAINFAWCENMYDHRDLEIGVQRYSFPGVALWNELGYMAVEKDSTQSHPALIGFENEGMLLAWADFGSEESDIYYNYVNGDGSLVFNPAGEVVTAAPKAQYEPHGVLRDDAVYLVWADGLSSGKTEILGLYMQKINNETTDNQDEHSPAVLGMKLKPNYPNPFNPHTNIAFELARGGKTSLRVYNTRGQLVKELFSGDLGKGEHSFVWDGTDAKDSAVSSGLYFYSLENGKQKQSRKMILMK